MQNQLRILTDKDCQMTYEIRAVNAGLLKAVIDQILTGNGEEKIGA